MSSFNALYQHQRQRIIPPPPAADPNAPLRLRGSATPPSPEPEPLVVAGQGTFIFKARDAASDAPLEATWRTAQGQAVLQLVLADGHTRLLVNEREVASQPTGLVRDSYAYYWLSLDPYNRQVRFGLGEARLETQRLAYALSTEEVNACRAAVEVAMSPATQPMRVLRDPIAATVPLEVRGTDLLTMNDVAQNRYLPNAALPPVGRQLYDTIAGPRFELDADDFPAFSQAIKRSIESPDGWCYQKLREKQGEFGGPQEVYLRITLGHNGGESPGIPFVMEIWPPQCYSPVHQHGGTNAIIRVLHGRIQVSLFDYVRPGAAEPYGEHVFDTGAITWISPLLNQIHRLRNPEPLGGKPCITIQCYQYDESDTGHYRYFDYDKNDGELHQYEPDSDMDFVAFKARMQAEWQQAHPAGNH